MRDRILSYLSQGLKPAQVASIVGVSASYISQLAKDPAFMEALKERTVVTQKSVDEDVVLSNKYLSLEHNLLNTIENAMLGAELPALVRALEVIGNRQEKRALRLAAPKSVGSQTIVVQLSLPSHAIPEYSINPNREVVAIGDRVIAPMSSTAVTALFQKKKEEAELAQLVTEEPELTEF